MIRNKKKPLFLVKRFAILDKFDSTIGGLGMSIFGQGRDLFTLSIRS